jgi:hypothetical protein
MSIQTVTNITIYESETDTTTFVDRYHEGLEVYVNLHSIGVKNFDDEPDDFDILFTVDEARAIAYAILRQCNAIEDDE